ncbi:MAG: heavy-metal-associated domain-containing protein [Phycisphaerales bacterium]|nr:heavy-metal-associated domain-containing protein [Phycisphaerales bacterium]
MRNALNRGSIALSFSALAMLGGCDCSSCDSGDAPDAAAMPALPTTDAQSGATPAVATFPVSFDVKGMHCNGCAEAIAEETRGIAGVTAVVVSFDESRADVTMIKGADAANVEAAIRKLGYTVSRRN